MGNFKSRPRKSVSTCVNSRANSGRNRDSNRERSASRVLSRSSVKGFSTVNDCCIRDQMNYPSEYRESVFYHVSSDYFDTIGIMPERVTSMDQQALKMPKVFYSEPLPVSVPLSVARPPLVHATWRVKKRSKKTELAKTGEQKSLFQNCGDSSSKTISSNTWTNSAKCAPSDQGDAVCVSQSAVRHKPAHVTKPNKRRRRRPKMNAMVISYGFRTRQNRVSRNLRSGKHLESRAPTLPSPSEATSHSPVTFSLTTEHEISELSRNRSESHKSIAGEMKPENSSGAKKSSSAETSSVNNPSQDCQTLGSTADIFADPSHMPNSGLGDVQLVDSQSSEMEDEIERTEDGIFPIDHGIQNSVSKLQLCFIDGISSVHYPISVPGFFGDANGQELVPKLNLPESHDETIRKQFIYTKSSHSRFDDMQREMAKFSSSSEKRLFGRLYHTPKSEPRAEARHSVASRRARSCDHSVWNQVATHPRGPDFIKPSKTYVRPPRRRMMF